MQNAFFKLFRFAIDFECCFCTDREKRPLARSFVVEQILNLQCNCYQKEKILTNFFHRNQLFERTHFSHMGRKGLKFDFALKQLNFSFMCSTEKRVESHRKRSLERTSNELLT